MNDHTEAVIDAMHDQRIPELDEGALAYWLRNYCTDPNDDDAVEWVAANVPCWVIMGRVNWAEVARNVQVAA